MCGLRIADGYGSRFNLFLLRGERDKFAGRFWRPAPEPLLISCR